ncbi:MAG: putative membrane protein [Rhodobacteraceae bacterium HLUCCA12]|nr:MAG: putative membrane protein [Rhodobacteraceae bacterium HLUCCA12]
MGYIVLILGVALWAGAHLFKRLAPERRAAMGEAGKGLVAVAVLASIVLMVLGYRWAEYVHLWTPPSFLIHLNNLLMLLAIYLFAASVLKTRITRVIRHPQLTAVKTWALAHLLVKGSLAGVVLFGGLLAWAVVAVILINRAQRDWQRPAPASWISEAIAVVLALVGLWLIGTVHIWLGVWPYG